MALRHPTQVLQRSARALTWLCLVRAYRCPHRNLGAPARERHPKAGREQVAESTSNEVTERTRLEDRPRVLIVDDEPGVRQVIRVNLVMQGHEVVEAKNGAQALKAIDENGIDLMILDLMMPKVSGWDVLEEVRKRRGSRAMPIIVLSAVTTEDAKVKAFDLGAADYIVKPFAVGELLARVNRTLHERKEKQVLAEFSITDWVTGLFNRRYLELRLPQEVSRAHRYGTPLTALFFEVDQLPWLMEERGPQFVDGVLQEVASLVRGETRACDVLFRYDGDFFVALLPDTPLAGGIEVADRIRRRMLETEWHQGVGISGTFGIVELEEGEEAAKFIGRAEDALMNAKRLGGNALWPPKEQSAGAEAGGDYYGAGIPAADPGFHGGTGVPSPATPPMAAGAAVEQYPVEEGGPAPLIQEGLESIAQPAGSSDWGELQSSATQRIDPSLLAQVQRDLSQGEAQPAAYSETTGYAETADHTGTSGYSVTAGYSDTAAYSETAAYPESAAQPETTALPHSAAYSEGMGAETAGTETFGATSSSQDYAQAYPQSYAGAEQYPQAGGEAEGWGESGSQQQWLGSETAAGSPGAVRQWPEQAHVYHATPTQSQSPQAPESQWAYQAQRPEVAHPQSLQPTSEPVTDAQPTHEWDAPSSYPEEYQSQYPQQYRTQLPQQYPEEPYPQQDPHKQNGSG